MHVDVWLVELERDSASPRDATDARSTSDAAANDATLSADERARAQRFASDELRRLFIRGRVAVRDILSRYLDARAPDELRFAYNPYGRPRLLDGRGLGFNFTRSGPLALCAVARTREVGIDLEEVRGIPEAGSIVTRFFSVRERELLAKLDAPLDSASFNEAFYAGWTRKEAFIKALGLGLAQPLDSFSVSLLPRQRPRLLQVPNGSPRAWTLHAFRPAPGYTAALAIHARPIHPRFFRWHPGQGS